MENNFWVPECNKCIHNKECEEKHIYCDGINYKEKEIEEIYTEQETIVDDSKEIDYLQTFKDLVKNYVDMLYKDFECEINYEQQKTIEHIEDLLKRKEEMKLKPNESKEMKTVTIELTKKELSHIINDMLDYIDKIADKCAPDKFMFYHKKNDTPLTEEETERLKEWGFFERKALIEKLKEIDDTSFPELCCKG